MFEKEAIEKSTLDLLRAADVPENHKAALVTIVNKDGAHIAFARKYGDSWTLKAYFETSHTGDMNYGAVITKTW